MLRMWKIWIVLLVTGVLTAHHSVAVADSSEGFSTGYTLSYKVTSRMWNAEQKQDVATSLPVLDRIHKAFGLWESASGGVLHFEYAGLSLPAYDSVSQVPYDGIIHVVLNGRYNFHGEHGMGSFVGKIPDSYKKGYLFLNKNPKAYTQWVITHEIGHALGLPHAATNASVMFSGPHGWGEAELPTLAEQDGADVRSLWGAPGAIGVFTISGKIETTHAHSVAFVFAVNTRNGHTYSARSDHMGRFTVSIMQPGEYHLIGKAAEVAWDIPATIRQRKIPQSPGWYVSDGVSASGSLQAKRLKVSAVSPVIDNLSFLMIDEPAAFGLNELIIVNPENAKHRFLAPGAESIVEFTQVINLVSVKSYGSEPDYAFSPVVKKKKNRYQVTVRIAKDAEPGERLVVAEDTSGRMNVGLVGINISRGLK